MEFRYVSFSDLGQIRDCVFSSGCRACDSSAVNLYIWRDTYKPEICIEDGFLFRRNKCPSGSPRYSFPLGSGDIGMALEKIRRDAEGLGALPAFSGLTQEQRALLSAHMSGVSFEFEECRDRADYIYSAESLASLSGKKYHSKRNFINRFFQLYGSVSTVLPITPEDIPEVAAFSRHWCEVNGCRLGDSIAKESCAIKKALENWDSLDLVGAVLRVNGAVKAYNFASELLPDTADVHVEKADDEIEGSYAVINNALAKMLFPKYRYINREEDMGIPGLRKAKESYRPEILLMRYNARGVSAP